MQGSPTSAPSVTPMVEQEGTVGWSQVGLAPTSPVCGGGGASEEQCCPTGRILLSTNPAVEDLVGPCPPEPGQAFPFKGLCLTGVHWCIVLEVYSKMFPLSWVVNLSSFFLSCTSPRERRYGVAQFKYPGAEVCPTGDQALLRPVDSAFVLDEAFVVARVFSHSVMEFLFVAGGRGHSCWSRACPAGWAPGLGGKEHSL